jgi:DNA helicase HerA-like ATPase
LANRHGLVAGATGSGKTITLQTLVEGFSALGTPVLLTDVKGDLAGLSQPGDPRGGLAARAAELGLKNYGNRAFPVCFWDLFGQQGHPLRVAASSLGPMLLARMLDLNEVQSGVLHIIFRIADDQGLLLLDLKDLRSMTAYAAENAKTFKNQYGTFSPASIGAIQRGLLRMEEEGADFFFGEPGLRIEDLAPPQASGMVHILAAQRLIRSPRLYSTLLLWLLSELFEQLPEVGDLPQPRLALMFDEAHLLFSQATPALLEKMEQVVRLIRSKGVGVYFITQSPSDVPANILAQLGNRVQHALRAFTPQDREKLSAAAKSFRPNPAFKTTEAISSLAIGEALVSFLQADGQPGIVERALILPPQSLAGAISHEQRQAVMRADGMGGRYDVAIDRESAYEMLAAYCRQPAAALPRQDWGNEASPAPPRKSRQRESVWESAVKQAGRSIGRELGRGLFRGLLGTLFGGRG